MPPTQTCIVAAGGPVTVRPGGRPVGPGEIIIDVDTVENAAALRRGALKPYDGPIPDNAIAAPTRPPSEEPVDKLAPLTAEQLQPLTVAELQDLAADRGVDITGARRKAALIDRLISATTTPGGDQ